MLFYLTDSLIVSKDSSEYDEILKAVGYLAISVNERNHLLMGDFDVIEHFNRVFADQFLVGPIFNYIYQNYSTLTIPKEITYYIQVINGCSVSYMDGNKQVEQLSYKHFSTLERCYPTTLLAEDENDARFFEFILQWYKDVNKLKLNHSLIHRHGGGECTARELNKLQLSNGICITIIDTDKKCRNDSISIESTAGKCMNIYKESPISKLHLLHVHEIENLIPLNYIDKQEVCGGFAMAANKRSFDYLRSNAENILPFFDYKKGLQVKDIANIDKNYIQLCIDCIPEDQRLSNSVDGYKQMSKETYVIKGLGSGILRKTLSYINSPTGKDLPILLDYQKVNWTTIAQLLLNWGCARNAESLS